MYSVSRIAQQQTRCFSISRTNKSVLDYFKFFKKKNDDAPKSKDTNEVIKEVEAKQDELELAEKIEILGRKNPRYTDKELIKENLNGFQIHRWIPKSNSFVNSLYNSDNYASQVSAKLDTIFTDKNLSKTQTIDDLYTRFNIFKTIQKLFIIQIPDSKFTELNSFDSIESYLIKNLDPALKLSKKSEFQPDAVDLNPEDFKGTNVSVGEWTFEKEKQRTYKKLLKKASDLEKLSVKEYKNSSAEPSQSQPATQ